MKYKEEFKSGMIFRSKTHPQYDFVIDFVDYYRLADNSYDFYFWSTITWYRINEEAFDKFVSSKLGVSNMKELIDSGRGTFPYAFSGESKIKSIKSMIRKYNMEYVGMIDKKIKIYFDNEKNYSSGIVKYQKREDI